MSSPAAARSGASITPILVAGSLILILSFGIRSGMGVFQKPISADLNWPRAEFSFALALQNIVWGLAQPMFSYIAERFGDRKSLYAGALLYAAGLAVAANSWSPAGHDLGVGLLVGMGVAGTAFGVVLAVVGRAAPPEKRSQMLGLVTGMGSLGQVLIPPLSAFLERTYGWRTSFLVFAAAALIILALTPFMKAPPKAPGAPVDEPAGEVLRRALRDPSYACLFLGFFSCGYQLAFITAHFPAFVGEVCGSPALGGQAIAVIGAMNVIGTIMAGKLGARFRKSWLLSGIYTIRTLIAAWFILTPMTPTTVMIFSVIMGATWLATVPLTSGVVADLYGLRYMGTLYGLVFLSHQIGGFLGVWLGGLMYDRYGSYDAVWWVGVGVGAFSALIHLPVKDRAPVRALA